MAYDSNLRKLWDEPDAGITPQEVAMCIQDYRVDELGNVDIGMMCTSPKINKWDISKPFCSPEIAYPLTEEGDAQKAADRKAVYQGLLIPTPLNAGMPVNPEYGRMYLGKLAYQALMASQATPNWEYQHPRGLLQNEPYRIHDFDGYDHFAEQPFDTKCSFVKMNELTPVKTDASTITLNRFLVQSVRCFFQMTNGNVKMSLSDLFPVEDVKGYHFVVEEYNNVLFGSNGSNEFFNREPDVVHKTAQSLDAINKDGGYQMIEVPIDYTYDNTTFRLILGANYYSGTSEYPTTQGKGFIAPWTDTHKPFIFSFRVEHYGVLAFKQINYYYLEAGKNSFTQKPLKNYSNTTYDKNYSDIVGISLDLKRHAERYYVVGQNYASGVPSDAVKFMFRLVNPQANRPVIAKISDSTMMGTSAYNWHAVEAGSDEERVYLRFEGFIKSGERIDSAILQISADGGTTWTVVDQSATAEEYGFEFATDCDGSSIKLMLEGTI